jgi:hypothetical protein
VNTTLSLLYSYIKTVVVKTKFLEIFCDNCPATNKNNYVIWFFHYLIHQKLLFENVTLYYLIPGHTKFSVDGVFGTSKVFFRKHESIQTFDNVINVLSKFSDSITVLTSSN